MPTEYEPSPYSPGFSQVPSVLAGRDEILASADEALAIGALDGRTPAPMVLVGPRGMGKTALLSELASRAGEKYGWPQLAVEAPLSGHLLPTLIEGAETVTRLLSEAPQAQRMRFSGAVVRAGLPGVGGELHISRDPPAQTDPKLSVRRALAALMDEATERSAGVVLTLDEAHSASREDLGAIGAAVQEATRSRWPLVVAIAGLPSLRANRLPSYFERADWHQVSSLSPEAALVAITKPAELTGRPFAKGAGERLVAETAGYPYAVQVYGHAAWRASHGHNVVTMAAVDEAIPAATAQLERNLFAQRWEQASPREREYLVALAEKLAAGTLATGAGVADRLGKTTRQVASYRERLINKGTLVAEGERLSFVVPGLAEYILRR